MNTTADIRKENLETLRRTLRESAPLSKQELAEKTGLCVATCNTLLNEMTAAGEVLGEKCRVREVGRPTVVYRLDPAYRSVLCLYFERILGVDSVRTVVLSCLKDVLLDKRTVYEHLDQEAILTEAQAAIQQHPNISAIVVGTPSIAENGVIRHCDIEELEGVALARLLEERWQLPVCLENDMYYKAYGFYRREGEPADIVTLVNYPAGVLPGSATVYRGTVLKGANLSAGMVGFLDYGISRKEQAALLTHETAPPFIVKAVTSLIAVLNPHKMLFTGDLLHEDCLLPIREACLRCIPEDYLPEFKYVADTDPYYLEGMYWTAVSKGE